MTTFMTQLGKEMMMKKKNGHHYYSDISLNIIGTKKKKVEIFPLTPFNPSNNNRWHTVSFTV